VAVATPLSAQELKIGYVNSERVLREAAPAKAAQAKLEAEFGKRERELNRPGRASLKAAADKLDKDAPTLSESERTAASANWSNRTVTCSASAASSRKT
jgi:outer membrane protein